MIAHNCILGIVKQAKSVEQARFYSQKLLTHPMYHSNAPQTATIRELRHDTTAVLAMVEQGEQVEIRRRNHPVAILSAPPTKTAATLPDFEALLQSIYRDAVTPTTATDLIGEARGDA
jgi:antitoxin (DNA-binding transcriptional repressor) of toxin-antitoxin stability system